jgi:hypothetical protein
MKGKGDDQGKKTELGRVGVFRERFQTSVQDQQVGWFMT